MTHERQESSINELLPSDVEIIVPTSIDIANLSEIFYDLFSDIRPLGQRDLAYFRGLLVDFGHHDIREELKRFHAWSLDKGDGAVQNPRSRFRSWLRRTRDNSRYYGGDVATRTYR
jgi:hypothetical protein